MKIEITGHYWPNTPELREIKIKINGVIVFSSFMNQDEIWDLGKQLIYIQDDVMKIGNKIDL